MSAVKTIVRKSVIRNLVQKIKCRRLENASRIARVKSWKFEKFVENLYLNATKSSLNIRFNTISKYLYDIRFKSIPERERDG